MYNLIAKPLKTKTPNPDKSENGVSKINPGGDLLFHAPAHAVPSAYKGLTSLFGMGRGVSP